MSRRSLGVLGAAITATVGLSGVAVLGQDASPPAASPGAERGPYQATLRSGDCDAPGDIAALLADPMTGISTEPGMPVITFGPNPEQPVRMSESEVPVPLTDIAEGGHAVVVDDPAVGAIVACGRVGGPALGDDRLPIALTGPDGAPVGIALLSALGIEATNVLVLLALPGERSEQPDESPAPSASPDADGFVEPDPDEPGPEPDPEIDPREDSGDDVSG